MHRTCACRERERWSCEYRVFVQVSVCGNGGTGDGRVGICAGCGNGRWSCGYLCSVQNWSKSNLSGVCCLAPPTPHPVYALGSYSALHMDVHNWTWGSSLPVISGANLRDEVLSRGQSSTHAAAPKRSGRLGEPCTACPPPSHCASSTTASRCASLSCASPASA